MTELLEMGKRARRAALQLSSVSDKENIAALMAVADALLSSSSYIIAENAKDMELARAANTSEAMLDRLLITEDRIKAMADAVRDIAALKSPVGELLSEEIRPNGLCIRKKRVPIGVIGIIYEARPNVTCDAAALCLRSGNAVILKGGSEALNSNIAITRTIRSAVSACSIPLDAVQLIEDTKRDTTLAFMRMNGYVDVLIPRGSSRLISAVLENASVPVLETGAGNCHIYLDSSADIKKASNIVFNAKTQRIGVCNACESLVVHRDALYMLPGIVKKLQEKRTEVYADEISLNCLMDSIKNTGLDSSLIFAAEEGDYGREYLDYKISIKTVSSLSEAVEHINRYSTGHSESIISENEENARLFLRDIDSACVYWNASTRFTDGAEFGFGAEIGISTSRLHARGPMGIRELTATKYEIIGNGQIRE